jgi:hypothetical protein
MWRYIILALTIIVIIIVILYLFIPNRNNPSDAKRKITQLKYKPFKTARDYYELGNTYRYLLFDGELAKDAYIRALDKNNNDNPILTSIEINRIEDFFINPNISLSDEAQLAIAIERSLLDENIAIQIENNRNAIADYNGKQIDNRQIVEIANDPQNAHDSLVNKSLKYTLDKIKMHNKILLPFEDIEKNHSGKALKIIRKMKQGHKVMAFDSNEKEILQQVWTYISGSENSKNLKDSFRLALEDSYYSDDAIVCVNGRCSRILSCMAKMCEDSELGVAITEDMMRKEIIEKTLALRNKEVSNLSKKDIELYESFPNDNEMMEKQNKIVEKIRKKVRKELEKEYALERFSLFIEEGLMGI